MKKAPYIRPARQIPEIGLDFLNARCTEEDGCLLWNGRMRSGPVAVIQGREFKVRHVVWRQVHPSPPHKSELPLPTVCGHERCVHPDHQTLVGRNAHARQAKTLQHRMRIAQARRASGKIDLATARLIRASDEPLQVLSARHGIHLSYAHKIRVGQAWQDHASPFAQLVRTTP